MRGHRCDRCERWMGADWVLDSQEGQGEAGRGGSCSACEAEFCVDCLQGFDRLGVCEQCQQVQRAEQYPDLLNEVRSLRARLGFILNSQGRYEMEKTYMNIHTGTVGT